jgi:hypothetical protein
LGLRQRQPKAIKQIEEIESHGFVARYWKPAIER